MSKNLVAAVSGIPLHQSLQQITQLLQSEFERHENALAEIEHAEKHSQVSLPYPGRPGIPQLSVSQFSGRSSEESPAKPLSSNSATGGLESTLASSTRSTTSSEAAEFGTMFLNAALALIEKDSELRRGASAYLGGTQLSKEYAPEVVKMGILRKGKGHSWSTGRSSSRQPRWTPKQVVLSPGRFTYFNLKGQRQSIGQLFGSGASEELSQSQIALNNGKELDISKCDVKEFNFSDGAGNDSCFVIFDRGATDGTSERLWMAQDANDRKQWMAAIRTASRLESVTATLKDDSAHCVHVRDQIRQAESKQKYLSTLTSLLKRGHQDNVPAHVCVPIVWLRKEKQNMASIRNDMTMEQATKDLLRDMFELNGVLHAGEKGLVAIIGTLAGHIMEAGRGASIELSEASALTFAREVLYNSNRTQFGGDAYEAVDLICCNDLVFATPLGQVAAPIQIMVSDGDDVDRRRTKLNADETTIDQNQQDQEDQHNFLSVRVQADMVFNINVRDPTDDDEMVWSRVLAQFER
jgi:hypothetical protein